MFLESSDSFANAVVTLRSSTPRAILIAAALRFTLLIFGQKYDDIKCKLQSSL